MEKNVPQMGKNVPVENEYIGVFLAARIGKEKGIGIRNMDVDKDYGNSHNYTINIPIPEKDLEGTSRVEKIVRDFYEKKGFEVSDIEGGQLARDPRDSENKNNYLIGIVRDTPYCPDKYSIRVTKTDKPELFYKN